MAQNKTTIIGYIKKPDYMLGKLFFSRTINNMKSYM